jgi:Zn-dependent membrane protease YugP
MGVDEISFSVLGLVLLILVSVVVLFKGFRMPGNFSESEKARSEIRKKLLRNQIDNEDMSQDEKDQVS